MGRRRVLVLNLTNIVPFTILDVWINRFAANATPASYTENLKTVAEADTVQV